jgi:hypothetical protein
VISPARARGQFFFDGMACFRDRCHGMTSCGTGGIWSITSPDGVGDYFFGRTMIEDTTSTHKYFLQGFHSTYIPPLRASKQLMRAVPKIGCAHGIGSATHARLLLQVLADAETPSC